MGPGLGKEEVEEENKCGEQSQRPGEGKGRKQMELSPPRASQSSILSFPKKRKMDTKERLFRDWLRGLEEEGTCENQTPLLLGWNEKGGMRRGFRLWGAQGMGEQGSCGWACGHCPLRSEELHEAGELLSLVSLSCLPHFPSTGFFLQIDLILTFFSNALDLNIYA